ncbi:hypothetical protein, conserved [Cyanidioschyzon merolae strain 10D]|uniref:Photolyase/cryptochrome alpha/beta domain-containing protein n=1 Tax=Cyanidioschyzon merolae (strain NIES-3377 / 10D) TaxID=280699 RepID=M1VCM7_CYAM1|nr:hypothetical protein, conserved [Cyanidioschyzon merolae strain 10D]BAM83274.1 hypothetical protein, conserved [Cyanidioschyzon merolae strain 10D]|eukprot:XP_005539310.1 hypothetical protein, conserved [Cyanidioschyzon merolae strain 10D]
MFAGCSLGRSRIWQHATPAHTASTQRCSQVAPTHFAHKPWKTWHCSRACNIIGPKSKLLDLLSCVHGLGDSPARGHGSRPQQLAPDHALEDEKRPIAAEMTVNWIVWFRRDLRVHDHPGLQYLRTHIASQKTAPARRSDDRHGMENSLRIAFVYIMDKRELETYTPEEQKYLRESVAALRETIRSATQGQADLLLLNGPAPRELAVLCGRFANAQVLVEDDWCISSQRCFRECERLGIRFRFWSLGAPHRTTRENTRGSRSPSTSTFLGRDTFSILQREHWRPMMHRPTENDLLALWDCARENAPETRFVASYELDAPSDHLWETSPSWFPLEYADYPFLQRIEEDKRMCVATSLDAGGETAAIDFLRRYLRGPDAHQESDFLRSFAYALHFGCVSPRKVLAEIDAARRYRRRMLALWTDSPRHREARALIRSLSWHLFLSQYDKASQRPWHYWRWNGLPVRFSQSGSSTRDAPAVLFIHGFGASIEHWERNVSFLADQGYQVFCLDLLGFGRSTKPITRYTQELWERQVRDFVLQIVRRPVFIVGNSIGAYVSLSFAADHRMELVQASASPRPTTLCKGIVLINPAGPLEPVKNADRASNDSRLRRLLAQPLASRIVGEVLLRYLQFGIRSTLLKVYPVRPDAALHMESIIYRHSLDPGASSVIASGFRLPPSRPIPELLRALDSVPVLLIQGILDPLNDARKRAEQIAAIHPEVQVVQLRAGHCPHDEVPEQVNEILVNWLQSCEQRGEAPDSKSAEPPMSFA